MAVAPVTLERQKQQMQLIWRAMLGAVVVYGVVCALTIDTAAAFEDTDVEWPRHVFSAVAVALGGVSMWWRRHFLPPDPPTAEERRLGFVQFQGYGVVAWTLCDAIGVCGLVLALVVHDASEFIPFGAAAVALLFLHRPSNLPWGRLMTAGSVQS
jgi:F0F1-type ATP synthase membrane subunit c/vacuolar-type H+-ATPase subunit K